MISRVIHLTYMILLCLWFSGCASGTAYRHHSVGDKPEEVIYYPPPHQIKQHTSFIGKRVQEKEVKIAMLLPLSGKYEALGKSLFNAAQIALFDFNMANIVLMPFDTQGTAFGAVKATKEALTYNIDLILGPVFSKAAFAMADLPKERMIPVISFSNNRKLIEKNIYIMGWLPDQQVQRVVSYALKNEIKDFAAIFPNTRFGAESAKELRQTIEKDEEASLLKTEFYRLDSMRTVKLHQHVFAAYNAALNQRSPKDYDPELEMYNDEPIDYPRALLVPEGKGNLQAVIALLKKYNFDREKVQLLGSSQWFDEALLTEPLLEGSWFALSPRERKKEFSQKYFSIYNEQPAGIANLAYDSVALAATLARISSVNPYSGENLANPRGFVGTEGIFRFLQNGLVERGLAVYRIQNGAFTLVEQAPSSFYKVIALEEEIEKEPQSQDSTPNNVHTEVEQAAESEEKVQ